MSKNTVFNTSVKKSLLEGSLDETRAASRSSGSTSAVRGQASGVTGGAAASVTKSTGTDPVPVRSFLSDALEKALAATNATTTGTSAVQAKAGGFSGAATGRTTAATASGQAGSSLKDAVDAAIVQAGAVVTTDDSDEDEQAAQPTEEQTRQAALVAKLPDDFPVDEWESLPAKAQLKQIQHTQLSKTEQWDLLNAKTPMSTLRDIGEQNGNPLLARLQAAVDRIVNGEETDSSKSTPLQQRAVDGQLKEWKNAMLAAVEKNATPETTPLPGPSPSAVTPNPNANNTRSTAAAGLLSELGAIDSDMLSSGGKHLLDLAMKKLNEDDLSAKELSTVKNSLLRLQEEEQKNLLLTTAINSSLPSATWDTSLINNQDDYSHTPGTFGSKGNIADNGCGFIAINNANQLLGDDTNFIDTYDELNSQSQWTTIRNGELGMNPLVIGNYYRTKGYDVDLYTNVDKVPNTYDAYIMFYGYTKENGDGKFGAHYIAIEYNEETGQFVGYNNNTVNKAENKSEISEFLPEEIGFDLFIWGIDKPDEYQPQESLKGAYAR